MKYYINFANFEEYINIFNNKVEEFYNILLKLFRSVCDVEWEGLGYDKTSEAVYKQIIELEHTYEILNKYIDFMKTVHGDYAEGVEEVKVKLGQIEELINEEKLRRGIM